jgi:2-hydroxychromene-2-carboxylate isomerase
MATIEFWYEFASSYSYPAAMRIDDVAAKSGVAVIWKPFLLGPIFKSMGWHDSPFKIYPVKGAYMWRDMARICRDLDLDFQVPEPFPCNGLLAARLALTRQVSPQRAVFSRLVYGFEFGRGEDISAPVILHSILEDMGIDSRQAFEQAASEEVKQALRLNTKMALERGIFGAPSLISSDGELFWGNDRLEQAVAWAA